jgi:hypothetical protein
MKLIFRTVEKEPQQQFFPNRATVERILLDQMNVGVREISRLISRLRHRQLGVLVTTSAIARRSRRLARAKAPSCDRSQRDDALERFLRYHMRRRHSRCQAA